MNEIELIEVEPEECETVRGERKILESYASYLTDESRTAYEPVPAIYFPKNTAQVAGAVADIRERGGRIVVSGARTGLVGGAVGVAGASIISLERMNEPIGGRRFQAGVKLEDIPGDGLEFFPVDPTETTASLGGAVATDASGARSYRYGSTRRYIDGLTVMLACGKVLELRRGEVFSRDGEFVLRDRDEKVVLPVRGVRMPPVKNTAGIYLKEDMDMVDLFVGSEGTLGVITEIEIKTVRAPEECLLMIVYADTEARILELVGALKADTGLACIAMEYFDPNSIALLRDNESIPSIPDDVACALYLEILVVNGGFSGRLERILASCGLSTDETWAASDAREREEMKRFRHAVPEAVNAVIGRRKQEIPGLHKVSTDNAVPDGALARFISSARSAIEEAGLQYVVFGHIGDNHLHINMLPVSPEELAKAEGICYTLAQESVRLGGTVSAEHGVGRLKKKFLEIQFTDEELAAMRAVKDALDPEGLLNPGVIF